MTERICGKCELAVNDIEPVRCGLCERFFHNIMDCCGFSSKPNKELFKCGMAMFFCQTCRNELDGRSLRAYVDAKTAPLAHSTEVSELASQITQLNDVVAKFGGKVDSLMTNRVSNRPKYSAVLQSTAAPNFKRRRSDSEQPARVAAKKGTKSIVFEHLSISNVVATPPPPRFWLYLAGFNPMITNEDVGKIASLCLDIADASMDIRRLIPKEANTSRYTFVSFKIGLDPSLSTKALSDVWPEGIWYREFEDDGSKNSIAGITSENIVVPTSNNKTSTM